MPDNAEVVVTEEDKTLWTRAMLALLGIGADKADGPVAAFMGHLLYKLRHIPTKHVTLRSHMGGMARMALLTAVTDGVHLWWNPEFIRSLSHRERIGVLMHELLHCVLMHFRRLYGVNPQKRQIAFDLAVNCIVHDAGFTLPEKRLMVGEGPFAGFPWGASCEVYAELLTDQVMDRIQRGQGHGPGGQPNDGDGEPGESIADGDGCGAVINPDLVAPSEKCDDGEDGEGIGARDGSTLEQEWKVAVAEAAQLARNKGTLPGSMEALIDSLLSTPKLPWGELVRQWFSDHCPDDYSWERLNKRSYLGAMLPIMDSERPGHLAIALDTSGSVSDEELAQFCSELIAITRTNPVKLTVIWHDSIVQRVDEWSPTDGDFKPKPVGRGGTSHLPVFRKIDEMDEQPIALICCTDLETDFPHNHPTYPVLWVSCGQENAPFGEVVKL